MGAAGGGSMARLSQVYASRARRVEGVTRAMIGAEASIALRGVKEGVEQQLYDRTPLPVTGKFRRSVKLQFQGLRYVIGYDESVAPYAAIRAARTGVSVLGGHLLDMDPAQYMRQNYTPQILATRARFLRSISGPGARMVNGR